MKLSAVSRYFNEDPIFDAYSGRYLFRAHTKAHDDQSSSGSTARRRTMRTKPGTQPPERRAVRIDDTYWIVGNYNIDSFNAAPIRQSYGLKKSTGLMGRLTPGQACLGQTGVPFHAHLEFYRDTQERLTSSDFGVMWNIFCPYTEPLVDGTFLLQRGVLYRIRSIYPTVDEYQIAETDQLDPNAFQSVVFTQNGPPDIATDTIPTVSTPTTGIQMDLMKYYQFKRQADSKAEAGDRMLFIAQSALTPLAGALVSIEGANWRVMSVIVEMDAWALHIRRS